jgi:hypothetical protein
MCMHTMNKIISLDEKIRLSTEQKAALERKRKIMAVRKVFHCTHCASKCERCGTGIGADNRAHLEDIRVPYNFCDSCAEEYMDYIAQLQGRGDPQAYWHNHAWMKVWQTWIEYQGAIDNYLRSKEFRRLLEELSPADKGE